MRPHKELRAKVAQAGFDRMVGQISDGLLTTDEEAGLRACLPRLAALAETMGCLEKPLSEWSPEEMLRFLTLAIRAAVPLRTVHDHESFHQFSDEIPF
jgi:hypothetical protein